MEQVGIIKVWKLWGWTPQNWNLDSGDGEPAWLLSLRKQDKERLVREGMKNYKIESAVLARDETGQKRKQIGRNVSFLSLTTPGLPLVLPIGRV